MTAVEVGHVGSSVDARVKGRTARDNEIKIAIEIEIGIEIAPLVPRTQCHVMSIPIAIPIAIS
jgi:hypothetical protein